MKGYNLSEMEITLKKFFKYRTLRAKKSSNVNYTFK